MNSFWRDRSVLVTGCTGLLGSWMTQELVARGARVVGLVRDWVPQSRLFTERLTQKITTVYGCIEDLATLERVINEHEVDTVFSLGGSNYSGGGESRTTGHVLRLTSKELGIYLKLAVGWAG